MSWDLKKNKAKWNGPTWSIDVDLTADSERPWMQMHDQTNPGGLSVSVTPKELQGKHSTSKVTFGEAYVRQNDLIAIYPEHAPSRFGYQIDTRILKDLGGSHSASNAIQMEIWLSIQTSLLDSHPQLELHGKGSTFKKLDENCWTNDSSHCGLIVHPLDKSDCEMNSTSDGFRMQVFGRFMEKGVIRRMRFLLVASQSPQTPSYWKDRFEEFSASPLPLTT